jgi:hypothetical protein
MQTTSDSAPPKRTRAKAKSDPAQPTITVKKSRARTAAPAAGLSPEAPVVQPQPTTASAEQLDAMIATAAYFLASERGFSPGHELDDWLEAERRIKAPDLG